MKISKLLRALMFGLGFHMGVVEDGTGGTPPTADETAAATAAAAAAAALAAKDPAAAEAAAALAANGGVKPTDAEAKLIKEVMKKKEALTASEAALVAANAKLKEFEGIDPVKVRALITAQADAETKALEAAGEWTRLKDRMATEHTTATTADKAEIATLKAALAAKDGAINDLSIGTQFSQSAFITEETVYTPAKARILFGPHFDLVDNKVVGYDKPRGEANRTALVDQFANNLNFDAAMAKIVDADPDKLSILKSKVKAGAGSETKGGKAVVVKPPADSLSKISGGLSSLNLGSGKMGG